MLFPAQAAFVKYRLIGKGNCSINEMLTNYWDEASRNLTAAALIEI